MNEPRPVPHARYRPITYTNPTTEIWVGASDLVARIPGFVPLPIDADVDFYDHVPPMRLGLVEAPGFRATSVRRHILVLQNGEATLQLYVE